MFFSYILGSVPFGFYLPWLICKKNTLEEGSKNPGTINVFRTCGFWTGLLVFVCDVCKGIIPTKCLPALFCLNADLQLLAGVAAIFGHTFSPFLLIRKEKTKGGKAIATSLGVLIGLKLYLAGGCGLLAWLTITLITQYSSLASMVGMFVVAIVVCTTSKFISFKIFFVLLALYVILKHRENIKRIKNKTENKIDLITKTKEGLNVIRYKIRQMIDDYCEGIIDKIRNQ